MRLQYAADALARHNRGGSVIAIDSDPALTRDGKPVTVITAVNDNMPFLFDSIMGEITDVAGEPSLVIHPVFDVKHGKTGVQQIVADGQGGQAGKSGDATPDRVSLIHVHVGKLDADQEDQLRARLDKLLKQIRDAVRDWKPMLARLDQAISQFRYAPVPLDKGAVAEAIAFLEWLRDENFTFLGMREFSYSGSEKSGTLKRAKDPGLGILSDPDVTVLRRDTHSSPTTTEEVRAFLYGPDPLIVTKANAKSVIHRRAYLDYVGDQEFRRQGQAGGRVAHRRSVHLDGLHALGDEDPLSALKGRSGDPETRLRPARPFRQGADQRARILSARRAVPDFTAGAAQALRGDPRTCRPAAHSRAGARRSVRSFRLRFGFRAARPL